METPFREVGRGTKWCPECETPYTGNFFTDYAGNPKGRTDDEGRVVHPCDDCIDKREAEMAHKSNIATPPTPQEKVQSQVPLDMEYPGEPIE